MLRRLLSVLCAVTVLLTMNSLKLMAVTLERVPTCGLAEHIHSIDCYDEAGALCCGLVEHVHGDACYQQRPEKAADVPEEIPEFELNGDDVPEEEAVSLPGDEAPAEEEASFSLLGRSFICLSEIILDMPIEMPEVVDVLPVLEGEESLRLTGIERTEDDFIIYPIEPFEESEIAIETEDALIAVRLTDGEPGYTPAETVSEDEPADAPDEDADTAMPEAAEEAAEAAFEPADEEAEYSVVVTSEEQDASTDGAEAKEPADAEEQAAFDAETGEGETPEAALEQQEPAGEEVAQPEITMPEESAASEAEEIPETEESDGPEEAAEAEESGEGTEQAGTEPEEAARPEEDGGPEETAEAIEDKETKESAEAIETDGTEDTAEVKDANGTEETAEPEKDAGDNAPSEVKEPAAAQDAAPEEPEEAPAEAETLAEDPSDEAEEVPEEPAADEDAEAVGEEEQGEGETGADGDGEASEENDADGAAEAIRYAAVIDLAEVEAYPLSLRALMAEVRSAAEAVAEEAAPEEGEASDLPEEAPAEEGEAPDLPEEAPADAGEAAGEAGEGEQPWQVEYDAEAISVTAAEDDWAIMAEADFDATEIRVQGDGEYAITLLNGRLDCAYPAASFTGSTEYVAVSVSADVGAFPAGVTMTVKDVTDAGMIDDIAQKVSEEDFVEVERVHAVDIAFWLNGEEIEPRLPVSVVMTAVEAVEEDREAAVVHVDDAGNAELVARSEDAEEAVEADTLSFTADAFSVYAMVFSRKLETRTLASDGATYRIEVTYGSDAGIPDGAALAVREIEAGEAQAYAEQTRESLAGNRMITLARFFDIKIMESDAEDAAEVHPLAPVEVRVTLDGGEDETAPVSAGEESDAGLEDAAAPEDGDHIVTGEQTGVCAAHFVGEDGVDILDASEKEDAVAFRAESFSVYGVVYTVDFYYGNYEWHIDGGSYMGLRELVEKLEIAEDARAFVDDVESVVFSAPELVSVSRAEMDTTVGAIKQALDLRCEYSPTLTEEEIAAMDAAEVAAGEWVLISLKAFRSEESLTITLADGSVYVVQVEDETEDYRALVNDKNAGYITNAGTNNVLIYSTNQNKYLYVFDVQKDGNGNIQHFRHISGQSNYGIQAVAKAGYKFAYWLVIQSDGTTEEIGDATLGTNKMGVTNIAFFVPTDAHLLRFESVATYPSGYSSNFYMNTSTVPGQYAYEDSTLPLYYYSNQYEAVGCGAWDDKEKYYNFLGWYEGNSFIAAGDAENYHAFYTWGAARNMVLKPVFERKPHLRNYWNVWFDGSNGISGKDYTTRNNTLYSRINGKGEVEGAQSVHQIVSTSGPTEAGTVTLPTAAETARPQGYQYTGFALQGWYDIYNGKWYAPEATVTITGDTVFYADWFPESYDIGQNVDVFTEKDGVVYPDTSSFITNRVYDYNSLFNMPSIKLSSYTDENTDPSNPVTYNTRVNMLENVEYWEMAGRSTRDFLFISAVSGDVRSLSPIGRKVSLKNQNNETSRDGGYYTGNICPGIMNTSGLRDSLFGTSNELGKRYVGEADYLYLYDANTGYYYYDSDKNAASYNQSAQRFYVYNYTHCTDKSVTQGSSDGTDFLPFNYGTGGTFTYQVDKLDEDGNPVYDEEGNTVKETVTAHGFRESYGEPNYWFGLKSEIDFFLPNAAGYHDASGYGNRSVKGSDMVFKFSGDDDVWVYVDDELYLDMGGIHGKVYGEINFSQGTRTVVSAGATKINDVQGIMSYEAGTGTIETDTFTLPEGDHKVTIYYLERGSSQSNCAIYFNLAPRYRLRLSKEDNQTHAKLSGAVFGVYSDAACTLAARVEDTVTRARSNEFTTNDKGMIDVSGLVAGKTYYIKELFAPDGYPDVSEEVIALTLDASGAPSAYSTADTAGDNAWTMVKQLTSSEAEGSSNKGTFVLDMTVANRKEVSITAKKIWALLDGSSYSRDEDSQVKVKLQRYRETSETQTDATVPTYTVRLHSRYFADSEGPTDRDDGNLMTIESRSYSVQRGGSITFDAQAGDSAGIYSVTAQGRVSATNTSDTTETFFINGGWTTALKSGTFTVSNIRRSMDVYITFIGKASSASALGASFGSNVDVAAPSGETVYVKAEDGEFNRSNAFEGQALEVTLSKENNWTTTWTDLPDSASGVRYYYYVTEVSYESDSGFEANPLLSSVPAYVAAYSSDGLSGGGTITVRNTLQANKIRLRKRSAEKNESGKKEYLSGAEFEIYLASEYEKAEGERQALTVVTNTSVWLDGGSYYDDDKAAFVSDANGKFYSGYLPVGTYYIVEKKAPAGYKRLTGPFKISVDENGMKYQTPDEIGTDTWHTQSLGSDGYYALYIEDSPLVPVDITVVKVEKGTGTPLTGAEFTLTRVDDDNNVVVDGSAYTVTKAVGEEGDDAGKAVFEGLTYGRYRLEETKVPVGYVKLEGPYYIDVSEDGVSALTDAGEWTLISRAEDDDVYTVENEPGVRLPDTGGAGTGIYTAAGALLSLLAIALLAIRLRRREE